MNVVIWARVSSREQRDGYSIDAQLRVNRDRAKANGWEVVREFIVAESAKRGAERTVFNEMYSWVKSNANRQKIKAILSHKLDRVCRNMRDAVRLQELEDSCGVKLAFVDNQFGPGAAGALSFNVMAAVAQYYSDNLRSEVLKGMDEKVRQGWPTGPAPFGYMNVKDRDQPIQPHPVKSQALIRIFDLYAAGGHTFKSLANKLEEEGHYYCESHRRFPRTTLSYILNNRVYLGELHWHGEVYIGRYDRLIDRTTFEIYQDILHGRNRRFTTPEHPYAGGLFNCAFCGRAITGELIRRKLKGGGVREHLYYRCANNDPGPDHPTVRWKSEELEQAIVEDLAKMQYEPEVASWLRNQLSESLSNMTAYRDRTAATIAKRKAELATMQDRLLNAFLAGTVEEGVYQAKSNELKIEYAQTEESIVKLGDIGPSHAEAALLLFDFSQKAATEWQRSNISTKREILDAVCLNRNLGPLSLDAIKRKPFDAFAQRAVFQESAVACQTVEPLIAAFVDSALSATQETVPAREIMRLSA